MKIWSFFWSVSSLSFQIVWCPLLSILFDDSSLCPLLSVVEPNQRVFFSILDISGFPGDSAGKEFACKVGDLNLIPGVERPPGEGNGYPLRYSGMENSMDCIVHRVTKSRTRLSSFHFHLGSKPFICLLYIFYWVSPFIYVFIFAFVTGIQIIAQWSIFMMTAFTWQNLCQIILTTVFWVLASIDCLFSFSLRSSWFWYGECFLTETWISRYCIMKLCN